MKARHEGTRAEFVELMRDRAKAARKIAGATRVRDEHQAQMGKALAWDEAADMIEHAVFTAEQ